MGLLERVQKKAGEDAGQAPSSGRLGAPTAPDAAAPAVAPKAPAAPAAPGRPPMAPVTADGARSSGATPSSRAAAAMAKPTPQQAAFVRIKSRVHARLVEEMQV